MTVDGFISWLYASKDHEPCDEDIRSHLQALILTESERAAALVRNYGWPAEYADMQKCLADDIIATSPGK